MRARFRVRVASNRLWTAWSYPTARQYLAERSGIGIRYVTHVFAPTCEVVKRLLDIWTTESYHHLHEGSENANRGSRVRSHATPGFWRHLDRRGDSRVRAVWQRTLLPLLQVEGRAGIRSAQAAVRQLRRARTRRATRAYRTATRASIAIHRRGGDWTFARRMRFRNAVRRARDGDGVAARGLSTAGGRALRALGKSDRGRTLGSASAIERGCRHRSARTIRRRDARGCVVHVASQGRCGQRGGNRNGAQTIDSVVYTRSRAGSSGGGVDSMNKQPVGEGMPTTMEAPVVAQRARGIATDDRAQRRQQFEGEALNHLDALYSFALKLTHERDEAED